MAIRWNLTGTENQKRIMREGFAKIHFPFDRLSRLPGTPELGWRDLNSGRYAGLAHAADEPRGHGGAPHDGDDRPDPIVGEAEGRRWVMGVIYTQSARIYIDVRCEARPELAQAVLAAEIAHAVDFFLPMNDEQRNELLRLWNVPGTTWWEKFDYGREYFRLGGEAFMHEFVGAYTDLDFGSTSSFAHDRGVEPDDVRRILGIERTDAAPKPIPGIKHYTGGPDIYHRDTHRASPTREGDPVYDLTGFRPCKVCKPQPPTEAN